LQINIQIPPKFEGRQRNWYQKYLFKYTLSKKKLARKGICYHNLQFQEVLDGGYRRTGAKGWPLP
jgi:hypothetical protein